MMRTKTYVLLVLVVCKIYGVHSFHQAPWVPRGRSQGGHHEASAANPISDAIIKRHAPAEVSSRRSSALHASSVDPSAPRKKTNKKKRKNPKDAIEQWATEALNGRRSYETQIFESKATTLPEVLSEFWSVVARYAQKKFSATADDREYAAHVLFVVARCNLLKDYGMMRHLDKVLDFCSGGCTDFGRTITLQHYHPDIVLPPAEEDPRSRRHHHAVAAKPSELDQVMKSARSPYPAFGLTVAAGSATREKAMKSNGKVGRVRLDLEMLYNSVSGCSPDDSVDAHGSPHGMIPTSPDEVKEMTQQWLDEFTEEDKEHADTAAGSGEGSGRAQESERQWRALRTADDFVASSLSTPEELFSEVWAIVTELQGKVASSLEAEAGRAEEGPSATWCEPLVSTLLVAPRLHPFNSALFENLARNVDIALKQTPIMDRIEVEVYHPEYVCDGGLIDPVRRSPFPTLLIKHCGLKDELFKPSGMYRHTVPPLKLPSEAGAKDEVQGKGTAGSESETATEVSADDAKL